MQKNCTPNIKAIRQVLFGKHFLTKHGKIAQKIQNYRFYQKFNTYYLVNL